MLGEIRMRDILPTPQSSLQEGGESATHMFHEYLTLSVFTLHFIFLHFIFTPWTLSYYWNDEDRE